MYNQLTTDVMQLVEGILVVFGFLGAVVLVGIVIHVAIESYNTAKLRGK